MCYETAGGDLTRQVQKSRPEERLVKGELLAVAADGLDRAALKGLGAECDFFLGARLGMHKGIAALFMTLEERGGGFAAEIAVDALLIDIEFAGGVVFPLFSFVGHFRHSKTIRGPVKKSQSECPFGPAAGTGELVFARPRPNFAPMLSDRPYMRQDYAPRPTSILTWLLSAMVAGFVMQNIFGRWLGSNSFDALFALSPGGLRQGHLWTLATYALLHANILHILFNALGIFLLGRELLPLLGARRFLTVYLSAAVAGAAGWLAVHYLTGGGTLIGASGCVMALFILFACFYPNREITFLLFFVLPVTVKPKYLAWILAGIDLLGFLFSEIPGPAFDTGVAYSAHLGGMLAGWIYFRYFHANHGWDRAAGIELPAWLRRRKQPKSAAAFGKMNPGESSAHLRAEVDRILDKINSDGFGALTGEEKRILDDAKDLLSRH